MALVLIKHVGDLPRTCLFQVTVKSYMAWFWKVPFSVCVCSEIAFELGNDTFALSYGTRP